MFVQIGEGQAADSALLGGTDLASSMRLAHRRGLMRRVLRSCWVVVVMLLFSCWFEYFGRCRLCLAGTTFSLLSPKKSASKRKASRLRWRQPCSAAQQACGPAPELLRSNNRQPFPQSVALSGPASTAGRVAAIGFARAGRDDRYVVPLAMQMARSATSWGLGPLLVSTLLVAPRAQMQVIRARRLFERSEFDGAPTCSESTAAARSLLRDANSGLAFFWLLFGEAQRRSLSARL